MSNEQYNKIISNTKNILCESILEKISSFKYRDIDDYYVIQVYVKSEIKAKEMGEILTNIEEYSKKCGFNVLVDFLRG